MKIPMITVNVAPIFGSYTLLRGEVKPHIYRSWGDWICYLWPQGGSITAASAATPTEAYERWKEKNEQQAF